MLPGFETATATDELLVEIQAGSGVLSNDYPGGQGSNDIYGAYRYGFNGHEKSDEIKGSGNSYTAAFWEYDPRIGRRWNLDPFYKHSPYSAFNNNPLYYIDPLGLDTVKNRGSAKIDDVVLEGNSSGGNSVWRRTKDGWIGDGMSSTNEMNVVVTPLNTKVMERIRADVKLKSSVELYIPRVYESRVRDMVRFAKKGVANSLGEMLLLTRYQQQEITLGPRMHQLIMDDPGFQEFEKLALQFLASGVNSYTSKDAVSLGGKRGPLIGLLMPLPSSGQTLKASVNELTWTIRHVYITATLVHGSSSSGRMAVQYNFVDRFDLRASGQQGLSYDIIAGSLGFFYHDIGDNSEPLVIGDWIKQY